MIRLYGFEACGPCRHIKSLLEKFDVEYEYIDVLKEKTSFGSVPMLELDDGTQMVGLGKQMTDYIKKLGRAHKKKRDKNAG